MAYLKALQLWSVKNKTAEDFEGTLRQVAAMGYEGVEFAGYAGKSAEEMKNLLDSYGLKAAGSHISIDRMRNQLEEEIAYNKTIGNPYMVVPHYKCETAAEYSAFGKELDAVGAKIREAGMTLLYHNHGHEFTRMEGSLPMDLILAGASPENLQAEVDCYWVCKAGVNLPEYLQTLKGRCPVLHFKDMEDSADAPSTVFGTGVIDFSAVLKVADELGTDTLVIEQEFFRMDALEAVGQGLENLKKMV